MGGGWNVRSSEQCDFLLLDVCERSTRHNRGRSKGSFDVLAMGNCQSRRKCGMND